ncbi:hypothetical protein [Leptospira santarosai]|uniref:hypothetical protein n=1 Tax=Leptospira santarosai TaxID=28183 RepID=UPI0026E44541|nr:hypothetical protein [Leptospira santarosai]
MKRERDITIEHFYAAMEEGEKRFASRANQKPVWTEDRAPFTEEKYYEVESRRTGERCFASRICPSDGNNLALYQIVRYSDYRKRWLKSDDFVSGFRRFKERPEPLHIDWIDPGYKKTAIQDDGHGSVLQEFVDLMRRREVVQNVG